MNYVDKKDAKKLYFQEYYKENKDDKRQCYEENIDAKRQYYVENKDAKRQLILSRKNMTKGCIMKTRIPRSNILRNIISKKRTKKNITTKSTTGFRE